MKKKEPPPPRPFLYSFVRFVYEIGVSIPGLGADPPVKKRKGQPGGGGVLSLQKKGLSYLLASLFFLFLLSPRRPKGWTSSGLQCALCSLHSVARSTRHRDVLRYTIHDMRHVTPVVNMTYTELEIASQFVHPSVMPVLYYALYLHTHGHT
jgi:hypothetical protein